LVYASEGPEAGEIVGREYFNLFAGFLSDDILNGQGVYAKGFGDDLDFLLSRVIHIEPPYSISFSPGGAEKALDSFFRKVETTELGSMYSGLQSGRKEAESLLVYLLRQGSGAILTLGFPLRYKCFFRRNINEFTI
jgi:hypothetical protein